MTGADGGSNAGNYPAYLFHQGTNFNAYKYMGAHPEGDGVYFRVWAPGAENIFLCGDFNSWNSCDTPMKRITDAGIWECYVPAGRFADDKTRYKYRIVRGAGEHLKADPYAFYSELHMKTASKLYDIGGYEWSDGGYMQSRRNIMSRHSDGTIYNCPINIYEMHLGSWRTRDGKTTAGDEEGENYLSYGEIADELIPYVKKMGYTHIELMPVMEHPFDGSWGYQVCGFYAPTSRFGSPKDFMSFVDRLHKAGVGVILDWVPAHFPKDEHGLYEFDGGPLYEYQGGDRMEHKGWGTRCFDVGRGEVQSFLISNAMYWCLEYHIDGLRVDAVASMLYLDYDREPGQWVPNSEGTNKNLESIAFFKKLNGVINGTFPDVMMIAEESTAFAALTKPTDEGGLGFTLKWNMGWANDMFDYISLDPLYRRFGHKKLTFSLMYAFGENYILPVSHDEVVHGKKSLLDKNFGEYEQKFAGYRAFTMHQIGHPGKKMTFMGSEYGPFREWDYENQLEWFMLGYPAHRGLQLFSAELNHFYLAHSQLWDTDFSWDGFKWLEADAADDNVIIYERFSRDGGRLIAAVNFSGAPRYNYPVYIDGDWICAFSSDEERFGGGGRVKREYTGEDGVIKLDMPPLSAIYLVPDEHKSGVLNLKHDIGEADSAPYEPSSAPAPAEDQLFEQNVKSAAKAKAGNGEVKPKKPRTVKAKADSGEVKPEKPRTVKAKAGDGEVKPEKPRTAKAKVNSGEVKPEKPRTVKAKADSGEVKPKKPRTVKAKADSGEVKPKKPRASRKSGTEAD
ncbi:MAG: 1,4-alpha-glucan branching protein GlgB [Eubacteriales bacterium]